MPDFVKVANASDIKPGESRVVSVNGIDVGLFNVDGNFFAINNTCPHRGGPLGEGYLDGNVITCPLHGWRFDVTTGTNAIMPTIKVPCYQVKVEGEEVFVAVR